MSVCLLNNRPTGPLGCVEKKTSGSSLLFKLRSDGIPTGTQHAKAKRPGVNSNLTWIRLLNWQICCCRPVGVEAQHKMINNHQLFMPDCVSVFFFLLHPFPQTIQRYSFMLLFHLSVQVHCISLTHAHTYNVKCHKLQHFCCSVLHFRLMIAVVAFS